MSTSSNQSDRELASRRCLSYRGKWVGVVVTHAVVLSCAVTACASLPFSAIEVDEIRVQELVQHYSGPAVLLIDVRTQAEYDRDRIAESPLVSLAAIESGEGIELIQQLHQLYQVRGKQPQTIVLYCERGFRSARAQQLLAEAGIEAKSLAGGIRSWRQRVPADWDAATVLNWQRQ